MNKDEMLGAVEAIVFAAGEPVSPSELQKIFHRLWAEESDERKTELSQQLREAIDELKQQWADGAVRGFTLVEIAEGLTFRSNPDYAAALQAMREQRPMRLSKAALETLSIVAYRQPVTKPEVDHIRGVDCGGTLRLLLERNIVRIVGKKEEPGRPLLYGTTREFLSLFNLSALTQLPTLQEFHELTPDSESELEEFDVHALSTQAAKLRDQDEPAVGILENAMQDLKKTQRSTQQALEIEGIKLTDEEEVEPTTSATAEGEVDTAAPPEAGVAAPESQQNP